MSSPAEAKVTDAKSEMDDMDHDGIGTEEAAALDRQVAERHLEEDICGDNEERPHDDAGNEATKEGQVSKDTGTGTKPVIEDPIDELNGYESPDAYEIQELEQNRAETQSDGGDDQESIDGSVTIRAMPGAVPICNGQFNSYFGDRLTIDSYFKWSFLAKEAAITNIIDIEQWYNWAQGQNLPPEKLLTYDNCIRGDDVLTDAGYNPEEEHIEGRGETVFAVNQMGLFMDKLGYVEEIGKFVALKGLSLHSPTSLYISPILDKDGSPKRAPYLRRTHSDVAGADVVVVTFRAAIAHITKLHRSYKQEI